MTRNIHIAYNVFAHFLDLTLNMTFSRSIDKQESSHFYEKLYKKEQ